MKLAVHDTASCKEEMLFVADTMVPPPFFKREWNGKRQWMWETIPFLQVV